MKDKIEYQVSEFIGRKVFHKNYKKDELKKKITDWMQEDYKQAQFTMTDATAQILSGKHSQTVKYKNVRKSGCRGICRTTVPNVTFCRKERRLDF